LNSELISRSKILADFGGWGEEGGDAKKAEDELTSLNPQPFVRNHSTLAMT
jgi:hypothetical protein